MFKIYRDKKKKEELIITTHSFKKYIPLFKQDVDITVNGLQTGDYDIGEYVIESLKLYEEALLQNTITAATTWIEETGEAFHVMFDPEDTEDEAEAFIGEWNQGNDTVLSSFINRWFTNEAASQIAQQVRAKHAKVSSLQALQLYTAQAVKDLSLSKYNFGNVYLAIKDELEDSPHLILDYMQVDAIYVRKSKQTMTCDIYFSCDWEVEHGIQWIIEADTIHVR